jgi:hypothetical protein
VLVSDECRSDVLTRIKRERVPTDFMMKLAKSVLIFRSHFPGGFSHGFQEKSLARNWKTNIVHAPPRLAVERVVLPERLF